MYEAHNVAIVKRLYADNSGMFIASEQLCSATTYPTNNNFVIAQGYKRR